MSAEVALTDAEREALAYAVALVESAAGFDVTYAVERIVAARVEQARADERERIAQAIEDELAASANYMTPSERKGARWAARVARRA